MKNLTSNSAKYEPTTVHQLLGRYNGLFYAAALGLSALIGSGVAMAETAQAQTSAASNETQQQVSLSSEVFVIRTETDAGGIEKTVLKTPAEVTVIPGDRLRFILKYANRTGQDVTGFKATNPMPSSVQFAEAAEDWAEVSVDGGQNWGELTALTVETVDGDTKITRAATPADVTHVRWVFNDVIAKDASGTVSFNGVIK